MRHEVVGQRRDAIAHFLAAEIDGLADDVGMKLLALGDDGGEHGGADGAAEVAHHVGDAGSGGGILRRHAAERDRAQRRQQQRLADGADDVGHEQLVAGIVHRHHDVHERACREEGGAGKRDQADVEALHQLRHQRDQQQLRQAGPGQHRADLLGIVVLHLAEIGRQQIDRAEQRETDEDGGQRAEPEIALGEQAQAQQRLFDQ